MNVVVSNRQKEILDNANIDAIKDLNGLFNVNDLINKFKNYFFSKMILDATSVVDFASRDVLTTLANEIGAEKLIILLPSSPEPPLEFKKLLVELKIYNFTTNIKDVIRFIEKPNTYEDALKTFDDSYSSNSTIYVDNSIKDEDTPIETNTSDDNEYNVDGDDDNNESPQVMTSSLGDILNNLNLNTSPNENEEANVNENMNNNQELFDNYNYPITDDAKKEENELSETKIDLNSIVNNYNNNQDSGGNQNVFLITDPYPSGNSGETNKPSKVVIGVTGVTIHAGCTTLIYMLHKMLVNMKKNVLSIEVGKNDFRLFRDNKMISVDENELENVINNSTDEIILVDLNNYNNYNIFNDVLYLVEPSTIKLNGLMATNRNVFKELKDKKILLNKSLLSQNDIKILESEAGVMFFDVIEPLNDRIFNDSIAKLINRLEIK